jgi:glutaredoxin-like protein NrdH
MPPVTVYSKPGCQPCKATYRALDKAGITYTSIDITQVEGATEEVAALGYQGVPVVKVGDDHWNGLRPEKLKELMALAKA